MNIKPILFNTEMVRAILDGRKTVTRRLVKPQYVLDADNNPHFFSRAEGNLFVWKDMPYIKTAIKPPYLSGDVLWIRETWSRVFVRPKRYIYKADADQGVGEGVGLPIRWRPSIHMPKEAARIFLRVTDVRVERLQEITAEQAVQEGIVRMFDHLKDEEYNQWSARTAPGKKKSDWGWNNYLWHGDFGAYGMGNKLSDAWPYQMSGYEDPRGSFSSLWNLTVKLKDWPTYGWDANPWVWVIEFERCERPSED